MKVIAAKGPRERMILAIQTWIKPIRDDEDGRSWSVYCYYAQFISGINTTGRGKNFAEIKTVKSLARRVILLRHSLVR